MQGTVDVRGLHPEAGREAAGRPSIIDRNLDATPFRIYSHDLGRTRIVVDHHLVQAAVAPAQAVAYSVLCRQLASAGTALQMQRPVHYGAYV